jgi:ParB-like chromosome segregation protein Spo0J
MDIFKIPVHPAAAVFPMLDEDELAQLAQDIAENGLKQPLVTCQLDGKLVQCLLNNITD